VIKHHGRSDDGIYDISAFGAMLAGRPASRHRIGRDGRRLECVRNGHTCEPTALRYHCSRFIGRHQEPARINFTSEPLPVSATSRVLRPEVAKIITAEIDAEGKD
jgi:hypothetical protein